MVNVPHLKFSEVMNNILKRMPKKQVDKDKDAYVSLKNIPNYNPTNKDVEMVKMDIRYNDMLSAQEQVAVIENQLKALNDKCAIIEHAFHDAILEVKSQVKAQFGANSDELNSLGLKKKMDYMRPKARAKKV